MSVASFTAAFHTEIRSVTITVIPRGFALQTDVETLTFRSYGQALERARAYLGPFLSKAEGLPPETWGLLVTVSAGSALYGRNRPWASGGGGAVAVAPAELLSKIRREYRDGDGPLDALKNAIKIARAYPPDEAREAA